MDATAAAGIGASGATQAGVLTVDAGATLSATGGTIRATDDEQRAAAAEAAPEVDPGGDPDDPTVPMQGDSQIETFARLLADAHRSSSERAQAFVELAFNKIVELANVQTTRHDRMQSLVDSMQRRYLQAVSAATDGEENPEQAGQGALLGQMLAQFMSGQAQAAAAKGTNGAPNGHGNGGK